jgi:histidinol-phosphatase (PHP family)
VTSEHGPEPRAASRRLPVDAHVHGEFSWDAPRGSLQQTCARAVELGLPGIVFTEHADFVQAFPEQHRLDLRGYAGEVERCRALFPGLRILLGVELGEAHWFPAEARELLSAAPVERVLGSVHCGGSRAQPRDASRTMPLADDPVRQLRSHLLETLALVESEAEFDVLAHLDYPRRYWPRGQEPMAETELEGEYRAVLRAAARRGAVLEVNSTRGMEPARGLCPGPLPLRWWREEGGEAVAFGSDAHSPEALGLGFEIARQAAEAAGFRPGRDPLDYWRR